VANLYQSHNAQYNEYTKRANIRIVRAVVDALPSSSSASSTEVKASAVVMIVVGIGITANRIAVVSNSILFCLK